MCPPATTATARWGDPLTSERRCSHNYCDFKGLGLLTVPSQAMNGILRKCAVPKSRIESTTTAFLCRHHLTDSVSVSKGTKAKPGQVLSFNLDPVVMGIKPGRNHAGDEYWANHAPAPPIPRATTRTGVEVTGEEARIADLIAQIKTKDNTIQKLRALLRRERGLGPEDDMSEDDAAPKFPFS